MTMVKTIRKIDLMHQTFGKVDDKKCKDCRYLERHTYNRSYFKCRIYGISASEATDWAMRNVACGAINMSEESAKRYDGKGIKESVRPKKIDEPIEGQIELSMWEANDDGELVEYWNRRAEDAGA